jgi:hypothetical protein
VNSKKIVMKKLRYINLLFVAMLITAVGCKKNNDDEPTPLTELDLAYAKLAGSWSLQSNGSFTVDGQDVSINYPGFKLSFTDGRYTTTNAGDLFRPSGTWNWPGTTANAIELDDGKTITIKNLTQSSFNFTFQYSGTGGQAYGISGSYNILVKK